MSWPTVALAAVLSLSCGGEPVEHPRGEVSVAPGRGTYLIIDHDNGGECGDLVVDGAVWPQPIGVPGPISPGAHTIDCVFIEDYDPDHALTFDVPEGVIFRFVHWGP